MLLPIKLICDRRARKDGTNLINIQYCYSSEKRTLPDTEIYVPIRFWNKKYSRISKELPECFGNSDNLNERLSLLLRKAEDIVSFAIKKPMEDPLNFLKNTFHPNFEVVSLESKAEEASILTAKKGSTANLDLYFQIDDYSKSKEKKVCKDMPRIYRNMKEH